MPTALKLQFGRYLIAGAITAAVGIGATLLLSGPIGVPIQLAILASYPLILTVHFTLQRQFVFAREEDYALGTSSQMRRYFVLVAVQYVFVASCTALLSHVAGLDDRVAYLISVALGTGLVFTAMRLQVFH